MYMLQWRNPSGSWIDGPTFTTEHIAQKMVEREQKKYKSFEFRVVTVDKKHET